MKSIDFKGRNSAIGFTQDEYSGIFARKQPSESLPVMVEFTMCFQLTEEEQKQVQETGCIWIKRHLPDGDGFQPIGPDVLKPEGLEFLQNVDEVTATDEKLGAEDFNAETFDIKEFDLSQVDYFYKKQVVRHLKLNPDGHTEEAYHAVIADAYSKAMSNTANPGF